MSTDSQSNQNSQQRKGIIFGSLAGDNPHELLVDNRHDDVFDGTEAQIQRADDQEFIERIRKKGSTGGEILG